MPRDDTELLHIAAGIAACIIAAALFRWIGFLGVGLLGLLIIFLATSVAFFGWTQVRCQACSAERGMRRFASRVPFSG